MNFKNIDAKELTKKAIEKHGSQSAVSKITDWETQNLCSFSFLLTTNTARHLINAYAFLVFRPVTHTYPRCDVLPIPQGNMAFSWRWGRILCFRFVCEHINTQINQCNRFDKNK